MKKITRISLWILATPFIALVGLYLLWVAILYVQDVVYYKTIFVPDPPVSYRHCGVDDYINGNCIKEYPKGMPIYPLFTENDAVFLAIDRGQQKTAWGKEYTKEELLEIAQGELLWISKANERESNGRKDQVARIQSFIDILSKK